MDGFSRLDAIKTPKVERILLRQFHQSRNYVPGTLCLTDQHLMFSEYTGNQEIWVLYHHIQSVERQPLTTKGYPLVLDCKTFQQLHLIIPRESDCLDIMHTIKLFSQPESYKSLYAFIYKPKNTDMVKQSSGWALYDSDSEYSRMGVPNEYWKYTNLNEKYNLCDTYSNILYVPACADCNIIQGSAKFRSKGRFPVLSYYYHPKKSALCRSSQPLVGLRGRSVEDEQMIQCIVVANPNADLMYMMDTRPKLNAMANKAAGKGYENMDHYSNVIFDFFNIQNIHVMRESLQKLIDAACSPIQTVSGFLAGLESSGWMKHIHLILEASIFSAKALCEEGRSVMVHCSDGWDRTAQTCAIISLLIDSYYRTIHGFMVLIEREWLSFGHKFSVRSGHLTGDIRDTSPIFTQFLDCVWQVMVQFPTAFEFNEHFLITLHYHIYSCQFGTFLANCERDRLLHMFSSQTYSLWGFMWSNLDDFNNPLYSAASTHAKLLLPNTDIPHLSFWLGLYCQYPLRQHVCESREDTMGSLRQQNSCLIEHIKFIQERIEDLKTQLALFEAGCEMEQPSQPKLDSRMISVAENCEDVLYSSGKSEQFSGSSEEEISGIKTLKSDGDVGKESLFTVNSSDGGYCMCCHVPTSKDVTPLPNVGAEHSTSDIAIPVCTQCSRPMTEAAVAKRSARKKPTEVMSPESYSSFKECLVHIPEMNLPWAPLTTTSECGCGIIFTYSKRKYHCSHCGCVVCNSCGSNQALLPCQSLPKHHRVCKSCYKMMKKITQEMDPNNV